MLLPIQPPPEEGCNIIVRNVVYLSVIIHIEMRPRRSVPRFHRRQSQPLMHFENWRSNRR